jgi:hypothetical protein
MQYLFVIISLECCPPSKTGILKIMVGRFLLGPSMYVCTYFMFILSYVWGFTASDPPSKESYQMSTNNWRPCNHTGLSRNTKEECRQVGQMEFRVLDQRVSMSKCPSAEGWLASCLLARLINNISSYLEIFSTRSRLSRSVICQLVKKDVTDEEVSSLMSVYLRKLYCNQLFKYP